MKFKINVDRLILDIINKEIEKQITEFIKGEDCRFYAKDMTISGKIEVYPKNSDKFKFIFKLPMPKWNTKISYKFHS